MCEFGSLRVCPSIYINFFIPHGFRLPAACSLATGGEVSCAFFLLRAGAAIGNLCTRFMAVWLVNKKNVAAAPGYRGFIPRTCGGKLGSLLFIQHFPGK